MSLFQFLLLLSIGLFIIYILKFKKAVYDRFFMLIIGLIGIVFVIFPDLTTLIAQSMNIGRGTDLLFYTWVIFCLFKFLRYESRIKELERKITILASESAIENVSVYEQKLMD